MSDAIDVPKKVIRFTPVQRIEHLVMMASFVLLIVTGMPQKWPLAEISLAVIDALGGIHTVRWLHRFSGVLFLLLGLEHFGRISWGLLRGRVKPTMLFEAKDFTDAIQVLRFSLGRADEEGDFGHFDFRQKFEYWGLVFGGLVMVATGAMLMYPITVASLLPAELIPAAKEMHSNEAMLALLTILIWHLYGAHLSPHVFPCDTSIFTGKIAIERLREEHALEYEELFGSPTQDPELPMTEGSLEELVEEEASLSGDAAVSS